MTDIVERLRDKLPMVHDGEGMIVDDDAVLDTLSKAADEIERLRKENQELKLQYLSDQGQWIEETGRLREALKQAGLYAWQGETFKVMDIVRAALGEKE